MASEDLFRACAHGDLSTVQALLLESLVRCSQLSSPDSSKGWTPLIYAIICGHAEVVRCLLLHGVDPDVKSKAGEAPLHLAVDAGQKRTAQLLLEFYADPNIRNDYGETPLHIAVVRNDAAMVELLLRFKADTQARDAVVRFTQYHYTPEALAMAEGHTRLVGLLHKPEFDLKSPRKPPAWPSKSPSFVSSGRSTTVAPSSTRSRSNSGERSIYNQLDDLQELNLGILAAVSTCDTDRTLPIESPKKDLSRDERLPLDYDSSCLTPQEQCLSRWLHGLQLSHLFVYLRAAGYTSLPKLIAHQANLTLEEVLDMGVELPGEALILLAALELESKHATSPVSLGCFCTSYTPAQTLFSLPALYDWLRSMKLEADYSHFTDAGFRSLEQLLALTHTRFALSDDKLQRLLHIQKLGHRHRILTRLVDDARGIDPYLLLLGSAGLRLEQQTAYCTVM